MITTRPDPDHSQLEPDQWPRCCRQAYQVDVALGHDPQALRGLDPSGRYVQCPNCQAASPNIPAGLMTPAYNPGTYQTPKELEDVSTAPPNEQDLRMTETLAEAHGWTLAEPRTED